MDRCAVRNAGDDTLLAAYGWTSLLTPRVLLAGFLLVPCMIADSCLGKRIRDRLSKHLFVTMIETVMVVADAFLIARG